MAYVKWTFISIIVLVIAGFLHYTLPQHDVVRIISTKERQVTLGDNAFFYSGAAPGNAESGNQRFINFIETFMDVPAQVNVEECKPSGPLSLMWRMRSQECRQGLGVMLELTRAMGKVCKAPSPPAAEEG